MIIDLDTITFTNDFFTMPLPNGDVLTINRINEDFVYEDAETVLDTFNIFVTTETENVLCSSVIGNENDYFTLGTKYTEHLGKLMTSETIAYCYLEIPENE